MKPQIIRNGSRVIIMSWEHYCQQLNTTQKAFLREVGVEDLSVQVPTPEQAQSSYKRARTYLNDIDNWVIDGMNVALC